MEAEKINSFALILCILSWGTCQYDCIPSTSIPVIWSNKALRIEQNVHKDKLSKPEMARELRLKVQSWWYCHQLCFLKIKKNKIKKKAQKARNHTKEK